MTASPGDYKCIPVSGPADDLVALQVALLGCLNSDRFMDWGRGEVLFVGMSFALGEEGGATGDVSLLLTRGICTEIEGHPIYQSKGFAALAAVCRDAKGGARAKSA